MGFGLWVCKFKVERSTQMQSRRLSCWLSLIRVGLILLILSANAALPQTSQQVMKAQGFLTLGKAVEKTLPASTTHVWSLSLASEQYVVVEVLQKGIDVVVRILDPANHRKKEFDSPTGAAGTEKASWITDTAGEWKIEIVPLEAKQPGRYEIKWVIQREATEKERQIVEADSLDNLAALHQAQNQYDEAARLYQNSLAIREKVFGPDHYDITTKLNELAIIHYRQGEYAEAESLFLRALKILEGTLGPDHADVAGMLNNLASLYETQDKYTEAESFYTRARNIYEKILGPNSLEVATLLNNMAGLYKEQTKYAEAESLYKRALEIRESASPPDYAKVAGSLNNLASFYDEQAKYTEAESHYSRAVAMMEKATGPHHPDLAIVLGNLGEFYRRQGKYDKAEPLARRALEIDEKVLGPEHPYVASDLMSLGELYRVQGKYVEAEPLFKRAITINEKAMGPKHGNVARALNFLAELFFDQGRYSEAEPLFQRSLSIREEVLGPEHPRVATALNSLGGLYSYQGRYAEAEVLYRRAITIDEKTLGPDHPALATKLGNLASVYQDQIRYAEAELLYQRALAVSEKALGSQHPEVANLLNNLGSLYRDQGEFVKAESRIQRALAIWEEAFGPNHPKVALGLNNLASIYRLQDKYAQAESLFVRSVAIREQALGPNHPEVAFSLYNFAMTLFLGDEDKLETALPMLERAINIWTQTSTFPTFRSTANAWRAQMYKRQGKVEASFKALAEALQAIEHLRPRLGGGDEARAGLVGKYAEHFQRMVDWQLETGNIANAFEYAERGRARVLLDQLAASQIDLLNGIPEEPKRLALGKRQTDAKARMAEFQQRLNLIPSRKDLSKDDKNKQITVLKDSLRVAEKSYQQTLEEIKIASPAWQNVLASSEEQVALATIQQTVVPEKSLMLLYQIGRVQSHLFVIPPSGQETEVVSLQFTDQDTSVLQVKAGPLRSSDLKKILLGENESSNGLLQHLKIYPDSFEKFSISKLHALRRVLVPDSIWLKIKACVEVTVIPDGLLHQLPFEVLVEKSGATSQEARYWLDEGPVIRYAPSATILYRLGNRQTVSSTAQPYVLSLSDPIFDHKMVTAEMRKRNSGKATASQDTAQAKPVGIVEELMATSRSQKNGLAEPLSSLPATALETDSVRKHFGVKNVKVLQGLQADEPNLRANIQGKRYLHFATHGLVELQHSSLSNSLALTLSPQDTVDSHNDGFLKLYEIYELQLPDCELAVLSACDTQYGRLFEGEGVFALSRGFLAAGALRVIASHWQVKDLSTAELIGAFFRTIATAEKEGKPVDYAQALRDAKLKLRQDKNRRQWNSPYFWAPFIITGKR
jgi:tetratricopeptide (TPR) repeat protein/CHAT domain-containing protein